MHSVANSGIILLLVCNQALVMTCMLNLTLTLTFWLLVLPTGTELNYPFVRQLPYLVPSQQSASLAHACSSFSCHLTKLQGEARLLSCLVLWKLELN